MGVYVQNHNRYIAILNVRRSCITVCLRSFSVFICLPQILWQEISSIPEAGWTPEGVCSNHERGLTKLTGPMPEGSELLHQGLCHFILYSRPFRYHFIISVLSFNKETKTCVTRTRGLHFKILPFQNNKTWWLKAIRWQFPQALSWRQTSHMGSPTLGIIQPGRNLYLLIDSRSSIKWKAYSDLGRTSNVYSIGTKSLLLAFHLKILSNLQKRYKNRNYTRNTQVSNFYLLAFTSFALLYLYILHVYVSIYTQIFMSPLRVNFSRLNFYIALLFKLPFIFQFCQ